LTIGDHLARSALITVVKSAGVPPSGALLSRSSAAFSSGVFSPSLIAALSF
jgi:hypothetical protein